MTVIRDDVGVACINLSTKLWKKYATKKAITISTHNMPNRITPYSNGMDLIYVTNQSIGIMKTLSQNVTNTGAMV